MFKNLILSCVLIILSNSTLAATEKVDCLILASEATIKLELRTSNDFFNCFVLDELTQEAPIAIYSILPEHPAHKLSIYHFNPDSTERIAEVSSNDIGAAVFRSSVSAERMGFRVSPSTDFEHHINLTVTFMELVSKEVIVFVELTPLSS